MTKVFIGGSRRVARLPSMVRQRIDRMITQKLPIVIGDANGADKAVQAYLADRGYGAVEIFCVRGSCRNNLGGWRVREVSASHSRRDFGFYASKDEEMAKDADVGLMIWDGKSFGTLANAFRLIDQGKKVVIFVSSEETFVTIRSRGDWNRFVSDCAPDLRERLAKIAQPCRRQDSGVRAASPRPRSIGRGGAHHRDRVEEPAEHHDLLPATDTRSQSRSRGDGRATSTDRDALHGTPPTRGNRQDQDR